jgi:hypothetical protein
VKLKVAFYLPWFLLFGMVVAAANARAQTIAYWQIDLTANVSDLANNLSPDLVNPWGLAFFQARHFSSPTMAMDASPPTTLQAWVSPLADSQFQTLLGFEIPGFKPPDHFILLVVFSRPFPIFQLGANSSHPTRTP